MTTWTTALRRLEQDAYHANKQLNYSNYSIWVYLCIITSSILNIFRRQVAIFWARVHIASKFFLTPCKRLVLRAAVGPPAQPSPSSLVFSCRLRLCLPPPQLAEQLLHSLHLLQEQSAEQAKTLQSMASFSASAESLHTIPPYPACTAILRSRSFRPPPHLR